MAQEEKRILSSGVLKAMAMFILNNVWNIYPSVTVTGILHAFPLEHFLREKWYILAKIEILGITYYLVDSPDIYSEDVIWCISNSNKEIQQESNTHEAAWNLLTGPTKEHKSLKNLTKKFIKGAEKHKISKGVSDIQYTEIEFDF